MTLILSRYLEDGINAFESDNYTKAYELLKTPAEQGVSVAQYKLGAMYYYGQGVNQDYQEAIKNYKAYLSCF